MSDNPTIFLKSSQLKGDAKAPFEGQVTLTGFGYGLSNDVSYHSGNRNGDGTYINNIDCTRNMDAATASISRLCAESTPMSEVVITVAKTTSGSSSTLYSYAKYTLTNATIVSHMVSLSSQDAQEVFSLHFSAIGCEITPQDDKGNAKPSGTFSYDVVAKKVLST